MILILFSAIWSALLCFFLSSPFSFYPPIIIMFLLSIAVFPAMEKRFKPLKKFFYYLSAATFIGVFVVISYILFKPVRSPLPQAGSVDSQKKAVIFYCHGETESYSLRYSKSLLKNYPYIVKPMKAFQLKRFYKELDSSPYGYSSVKVASQVKNSLLNNGPYYFYIALSDYTPDIETSLSQAIKDGCGDITIINYTSCYNLEEILNKSLKLNSLKESGINIKISSPVCSSPAFQQVMLSRVVNMPQRYGGILLLGEYSTFSSSFQALLMESGYSSKQLYLTESVSEGLKHFAGQGISDLLYIDLSQESEGIVSQVMIPRRINAFNPKFKVTGIREWGYDIGLVRASIEVFTQCQSAD